MKKMIRVNEKRLTAKYNRRMFLAALPAVSVAVSLFVIVLVFVVRLKAEMPVEMYRTIFFAAYFSCAYGFVVCLIGSFTSGVLVRAHQEHTYIQIAGTMMIVSQHVRTIFTDRKWVHYKKMWVVKLADVEKVECIRNHLTITAKARYFNENAAWLGYTVNEDGNGVSFDRCWYDSNGGKNVSVIEITDFYTYGERIARHIDHCARKTRDRETRRQAYHKEMMEIARNARHPKKLPDRYQPEKRRRYR
ncbi:MAG: hypothetical protein J1E40_02320 [Oscillospiraceae bacterium]|nr:hypothetical protein [Oscillospiraceae bacterium]